MNPVTSCSVVVLLLLCAAHAERADSLSGRVFDENKTPVLGASIRLGLLFATTDSSGYFVLDGVVPTRFQPEHLGGESLSFQGNVLKVTLIAPREIAIALFDLRGRRVTTICPGLLHSGTHCIPVHFNNRIDLSQAAYIVIVRCGDHLSTFRWIRGLGSSGRHPLPTGGAVAFAKHTSADFPPDTLIVSKTGYVTRTVLIKNLFGSIPPITLYSEASLRQVYLRGPCLPGIQVVMASVWTKDISDTLLYALSMDTSGNFSGIVKALNHVPSRLQIVFGDTSGNRLGTIKTVIDSAQDTLALSARRIFIKGAFAPGAMGRITVCSWKDSTDDSLLFPLTWDTASYGRYLGTVLAPAHSAANVVVTISQNDTGIRRLGTKVAVIDSSLDSITLNCTSSLPVVIVGPDTLLGWGDTVRLHCSATDSVDSIVRYAWQFNGAPTSPSDTSPDTFDIVPMFVDSIYTCIASVTDADGNTTQASFRALMTCSVRNFRTADDEVASWYQTGGFSVVSAGRVSEAIDPATPYFNSIAEAAVQTMKQIDQRTLTAVIADLGTSSAARSLFDAKKASIDSTALTTSASYPDSVMVIDNSPADGIIVYARFKRFFFQLTFGGFLYYSPALLNAENFISIYEQRVNKTSICRDE